jgi:two-component system, LytTR family, response regulator
MNRIKAILVDDELDGRLVLSSMLKTHCPEINLIAECSSVDEALETLEKHEIELIFLDINMPKITGFGMLDKINRSDFSIIFVTAYQEHAIKAIKYSALDYLLKPIDSEELIEAVKRAISTTNDPLQFQKLLENKAKTEVDQLVLPVRDGYIFVNHLDITRCEADSNYTNIYLANSEKHVVAKTLKEFESLLPSTLFFRIHKSHLINLNHLKKYTKGDGGTVTLLDNTEIDVSRRNKEAFLRVFKISHPTN